MKDTSYVHQAAVVAVLAAGALILVVGTYSQRVSLQQDFGVNAVSKSLIRVSSYLCVLDSPRMW